MEWTPLVLAAEAIWIVGVFVWLVLERRKPEATLAWIFVLVFLPIVGVPVYLLAGPRRLLRQRLRYGALRGRVAEQLVALAGRVEAPPELLRQVRLGVRLDDAPLLTATELEIYTDGVTAFEAMAEAIRAARHHVHIETYIYDRDATGRRLRDLLAQRAREGIEVRLLVDSTGAAANARFLAPIVEAGGHAAQFNPPRLELSWLRYINFRTHRKILIVDGVVGFLGGMNVSDAQTVGRDGEPPWRDTDLRIAGDAVHALQRAFFENWHFTVGPAEIRPEHFPPRPTGPALLQILRSGPDREVFPIHEFIFTAIAGADERIWITTAYLIPDEPLLVALRTAAHRGVDVRVLVPERGDSRFVAAAARAFFDDLLAAGVRIWEYGPAMLHAKTMVVDSELAIIGSANFDNRSFKLSFEVAAAVYGRDTAERLAVHFQRDLAGARELNRVQMATRPFVYRVLESGARLFAGLL